MVNWQILNDQLRVHWVLLVGIIIKKKKKETFSFIESSRLVSCPKLIKTLQQTLDDARSNELITFKKMAKINDMNE
jgi:hypothetical protein